MDCTKTLLNSAITWCLAYSLALSPFAGLPAAAQAQTASSESELSQANRLLLDLQDLMDRALYPTVPRLNRTGLPSPSELALVQSRLMAIKHGYENTFLARLSQTTDPTAETDLAIELNSFYSDAQKFEGLKMWLGEPSHPESWDALYSLAFPLSALSQLDFIAMSSINSAHFAVLPLQILNLVKAQNIEAATPGFTTSLEVRDRVMLRFRINPEFVEQFEKLALISNPNTRNVVTYSLWWSAHRMYDSYAATIGLLRWPLANLEEPSQALQQKFVSFRVKRELVIQRLQQQTFQYTKPAIFKALLNALDSAHKADRGWMTDLKFLTSFNAMVGLTAPTDLKPIHDSEFKAVILALGSFLNLSPLTDLTVQSERVLYDSLRMALRWRYLINPEFNLSDEAKIQLAEDIDFRAKAVTDEILASTNLHADLLQIGQTFSYKAVRDHQRLLFQHKLQLAADKMHTFTKQSINFNYLLTAQQPYLQSLNLSPFLGTLIETLRNQPTYLKAYTKFRSFFFTYLQGFSSPKTLTEHSAMNDYFAFADSAKWNPQLLTSSVDAKYIQALAEDEAARKKDLTDLVKVGKLLKFNIYDTFPHHSPFHATTVETLHVDDGWLWGLFGSERRAYLAAMKNDLINNSPLLGSQLPDDQSLSLSDEYEPYSAKPMGLLWENLADAKTSSADKITTTDAQLLKVLSSIKQNNLTLDKNLSTLQNSKEDNLKVAGSELKTLMLRASQLSVGLQQFAGFDNYFAEMKNELLMPGFAGEQWEKFSSWSNQAFYYMVGFFVLQAAGKRVMLLGKAMDTASHLLAPIFGPNLSSLNYLFIGIMGVPLVQDSISGFVTEPGHLSTLNDFFACGAGAPCVALYSDVAAQQALRDSARSRLVSQAVQLAVLYLGLKLASGIGSRLSKANPKGRAEILRPQLDVLGLTPSSPLSPQILGQAETAAMVKARALKNPVASAAAETYAKEARRQIEQLVWQEADRWSRLELRYKKTITRLGLNTREGNWRDLRVINTQMGNLLSNYKAGLVPTFDYLEMKNDLYLLTKELTPVYQEMEKNPGTRQFMERVWDSSRGISPTQIAASLDYYRSANYFNFQEALNNLLDEELGRDLSTRTRSTPAMDKLVQRLNAVLARNSENSEHLLESVLQAFRTQAGLR